MSTQKQADKFVEVWNASNTLAEAAAKLGMTPRNAATRACKYRKAGAAIKKFKAGRPPIYFNGEGKQ